jgi:hypothetical protein
MSKSMLCWAATGIVAAAIFAYGTAPSAAMGQSLSLSSAIDSDAVLVAQQGRKGKGKGTSSKPKISKEHQERIRQHVPQEYHQYIPGMSSGGGSGR